MSSESKSRMTPWRRCNGPRVGSSATGCAAPWRSPTSFFCVAIRRDVVEEIGLLDEVYGLGYYEDDDYCRRASQANYKLVIADDVFVHHDHSVSFDKLGAKAAELMARNRGIFERRWGPWPPHRYRDEAGFGS